MQRYYTSEKLLEVTKHRGYNTIRAVANGLSKYFGIYPKSIEKKIITGHFSREEMIVIAAYFEMTPKEFCDVFLNGVFNENDLGHYTAHVESPYEFLHPPKGKSHSQKREERRQANLEEIVSQIEQI